MSAVTAVPIRPLARGSVVKLWLALILLLGAAGALAWWTTRSHQEIVLPSGVRYRVLAEGTGDAMTTADVVALRYKLHVGSVDAPVIQDSDESGEPFITTTAEVFPGFAEGLQQMRQGGRYILWLPPGTHASGPIPPNAPFNAEDTLVFELRVLQIGVGQAQAFQMQRLQQMMQRQGGAPGADPHGGGAPPAPPSGGSGGASGGGSGR